MLLCGYLCSEMLCCWWKSCWLQRHWQNIVHCDCKRHKQNYQYNCHWPAVWPFSYFGVPVLSKKYKWLFLRSLRTVLIVYSRFEPQPTPNSPPPPPPPQLWHFHPNEIRDKQKDKHIRESCFFCLEDYKQNNTTWLFARNAFLGNTRIRFCSK